MFHQKPPRFPPLFNKNADREYDCDNMYLNTLNFKQVIDIIIDEFNKDNVDLKVHLMYVFISEYSKYKNMEINKNESNFALFIKVNTKLKIYKH